MRFLVLSLVALLSWIAVKAAKTEEVITTGEHTKETACQLQLNLIASRTRMSISTVEQRIASRLAAMETRRQASTFAMSQDLQAISNKVDMAVSVLQDLFESKLASLKSNTGGNKGRVLREEDSAKTNGENHLQIIVEKLSSLEKTVHDLVAKSALHQGYQSDDRPGTTGRARSGINRHDTPQESGTPNNTDSKLWNFTLKFEKRLENLESKVDKEISSLSRELKETAKRQTETDEKLESILFRHDADVRQLSSNHSDTLSELHSHVDDKHGHNTEREQSTVQHNNSLPRLMSYLQLTIQDLKEQTNGSMVDWHSILSTSNERRLDELQKLVTNVTMEILARRDVTPSRQSEYEGDEDVQRERLNQTIVELAERVRSSDEVTSTRLLQLDESLRNLSALLEQHRRQYATGTNRREVMTPKPTYPPIPAESWRATAVFVALRRNFTGSKLYSDEVYDAGGDYSAPAGQFSPVSSGGVFFHSVSAGARQQTKLYLDLRISSSYVDRLVWETTKHDVDTTSMDVISAASSLYLTNSGALYSDHMMQTSWTVIGITNAMKRVVAFTLARTSHHTGAADPLSFQTTISSVGGGLSSKRDSFTAPHTGTYLLSLTIHPYTSLKYQVALMRWSSTLFRFGRPSTVHNGVDTVSKAIVVKLTAGDRIYVNTYGADSKFYSSAPYYTSFSGFLYDPLHKAPIAWSVGKNTSIHNVTRHRETLAYENVVLNEGGAWNSSARAIVAPLAGYYYVQVSAGALPRKPVHLYVNINGKPFVDLWRSVGWQTDVDHLSRSALIRLKSGDKVQITATRGTGVHSDSGFQTAFCGFLAYREA